MSTHLTMMVLNIGLMALVSAAMVGLLVWSVVTQYRIPGYEGVRIRPRHLRIRVKLAPVDIPMPLAGPAEPTLAPDS